MSGFRNDGTVTPLLSSCTYIYMRKISNYILLYVLLYTEGIFLEDEKYQIIGQI